MGHCAANQNMVKKREVSFASVCKPVHTFNAEWMCTNIWRIKIGVPVFAHDFLKICSMKFHVLGVENDRTILAVTMRYSNCNLREFCVQGDRKCPKVLHYCYNLCSRWCPVETITCTRIAAKRKNGINFCTPRGGLPPDLHAKMKMVAYPTYSG